MTNPHDTLRTLHRILRQRTDLESRLARGPKQLAASQTRVQHCENELAEAKQRVQAGRMAADDKQLQLKTREARVEDLNAKLNTAGSNKEYQAIKEQIAADEQANAVLADETFELLEKIDVLVEKSDAVAGRLETCQAELKEVEGKVAEERAKLQSELDRVLGELEQTEKELPGDVKADYARLVKSRGESCLAEVEGNTCGNCYQTLTPQIHNSLSMKNIVVCNGCGSILYPPERR